jgi:hypothetical protein
MEDRFSAQTLNPHGSQFLPDFFGGCCKPPRGGGPRGKGLSEKNGAAETRLLLGSAHGIHRSQGEEERDWKEANRLHRSRHGGIRKLSQQRRQAICLTTVRSSAALPSSPFNLARIDQWSVSERPSRTTSLLREPTPAGVRPPNQEGPTAWDRNPWSDRSGPGRF